MFIYIHTYIHTHRKSLPLLDLFLSKQIIDVTTNFTPLTPNDVKLPRNTSNILEAGPIGLYVPCTFCFFLYLSFFFLCVRCICLIVLLFSFFFAFFLYIYLCQSGCAFPILKAVVAFFFLLKNNFKMTKWL